MDVATVLLLHKSSCIVGAICFCYVRWRSREPGLDFLAAGYGMVAIASTLAGLGEEGDFPFAFWKLASFTIGLTGHAFMAIGLLQLSSRKDVMWHWLLLASVLCLSALVSITRLYEDNQTRAAIFNSVTTIVYLVPAVQIFRDFLADRLSARFGLIASLSSAAIVSFSVTIGIVHPSFRLMSLSNAFFLLIICIFSLTLFVVVLVQERTEARLRLFADTDALTGIPNRQRFLASLPTTLRHGDACIVLDIDHFKSVNDRFGHEAGDMVLRGVARAIARAVGPETPFGRIGGEEFAIFMRNQTAESAQGLAEKIRKSIESLSFNKGDERILTSISSGISLWNGAENADILRDEADQALYAAKRAGRNCVRSYEHVVALDSPNFGATPAMSQGLLVSPRRKLGRLRGWAGSI